MSENEYKKYSLDFKINCAKDLIFERIKSLSTISTIAFAFVGIIISSDSSFIKQIELSYISFFTLIFATILSLGYIIFSVRSEINNLYKEIMKFADPKHQENNENKNPFKLGYLPELIFILTTLAFITFIISML